MVTPDYDRRRVAGVPPTVEGFLLILQSALVQADAAQVARDRKRGVPPNIYSLGLLMEALGKVRSEVRSTLKSSDPEDLKALGDVVRRRFHESSATRKFFKILDTFLTSGRAPKLPTNVKPFWH